jgi:peptidoglycan-associated lipoprotein
MIKNIYRSLILIIVAGFLLSGTALGQEKARYNRHLEAGIKAFENQQYKTAIEKLNKGFTKIKGRNFDLRAEVSFRLGECYRLTGDFRRSGIYYFRAIRFNYQTINPEVFLFYAQSLQMNEKFDEAIENYQKFLEYESNSELAINGIQSCKVARKWQENPTGFQIENPYRINSRADEFAPTYADKYYSSIIFTSNREGTTGEENSGWTGKPFSDLFFAKKDRQGKWTDPSLIDTKEVVNTKANEGAPQMNSTFATLYFTRCEQRNEKKAGCRIYKSKRSGMNWGKPEEIVLSKDTADIFGHPTVNDDESIIIFSSDYIGTIGGKDLFMVKKNGEKFSRPIHLGDTLNTKGDELFPFLRNDTTLYFASNGHIGMGGLDIYKSIKRNGVWMPPVNMKYPVNSVNDDFGLTMQKDRQEGYFSSNRRGSRGGDDIFYFINPPVEITFKGTLTDEQSLQPVENAEVFLIHQPSGDTVRGLTDPEGFFSFSPSQINLETTYTILLQKKTYFNLTDTLDTRGILSSTEIDRNYKLNRIPDKAVVLPDILYDLGKWDLKPQYQDSLQGLIKTLDANKNIVIELGAHTDATASEEYNDVLSQRRAEAVVDYLINRGIDPERLVAKGYGERVPRLLQKDIRKNGFLFPKGTHLTPEYIASLKKQEAIDAARELNRRTEFRIIRKDYKPLETQKNKKTKTIIGLVQNPEESSVNYFPGKGDEIMIPIIINGYTYKAAYAKRRSILTCSQEFVKQLLEDGLITKDNFNERDQRYLKAGNFRNQTSFKLQSVRVGAEEKQNVEAIILSQQKIPVQIGPDFLEGFGKFTIDKENYKIIFKKQDD